MSNLKREEDNNMFDEEIIAVANDSEQADRLATESAVKECYEQHKAAW